MKLCLTLPDKFPEVMVANVDMLSSRMHLWKLGNFKCTRVILKSMAKNVHVREKTSKLNSLYYSFAKSIRRIASLSAEDKAIYFAFVVLMATCDSILEAHRIGQLA